MSSFYFDFPGARDADTRRPFEIRNVWRDAWNSLRETHFETKWKLSTTGHHLKFLG